MQGVAVGEDWGVRKWNDRGERKKESNIFHRNKIVLNNDDLLFMCINHVDRGNKSFPPTALPLHPSTTPASGYVLFGQYEIANDWDFFFLLIFSLSSHSAFFR